MYRDFAYPVLNPLHFCGESARDFAYPVLNPLHTLPPIPPSDDEGSATDADSESERGRNNELMARAARKRKREVDVEVEELASRKRVRVRVEQAVKRPAPPAKRAPGPSKFSGFEKPVVPSWAQFGAAAGGDAASDGSGSTQEVLSERAGKAVVAPAVTTAGASRTPGARSQSGFMVGKKDLEAERLARSARTRAWVRGETGGGSSTGKPVAGAGRVARGVGARRFEPKRFPFREIGDRHIDALIGYMHRRTGTTFASPEAARRVSYFLHNSSSGRMDTDISW